MSDYKLVIEVAQMLEDITNLGSLDDLARGDYQGILEGKAMQIIKKVKEA